MNVKAIGVLAVITAALLSNCATSAATGGASSGAAGPATAATSADGRAAGEAAGDAASAAAPGVQELVTDYAGLWSSDAITVNAGAPVKWYVEAPPGSLPKKKGMACGKTIKIPGLGWGTDTYNDAEGHLTLEEGRNLVYEFTPAEAGDILFTCWMGSECHYNYIHVIDAVTAEDAAPAPVSEGSLTRGRTGALKTAYRRPVPGALPGAGKPGA
jgi:hypothetical protein